MKKRDMHPMTEAKPFQVIYSFMHSRMGFQNQVTVQAIGDEDAINKARHEVAMCYGSGMLKNFKFKIKSQI